MSEADELALRGEPVPDELPFGECTHHVFREEHVETTTVFSVACGSEEEWETELGRVEETRNALTLGECEVLFWVFILF